jgi:hypothetical protein
MPTEVVGIHPRPVSVTVVGSLVGFPDPVNEKAARVVASGVAVLGLLVLVTGWLPLLVPIALGFLARVVTGPTLSPLGRLASSVVAPHLGAPRWTPGAPKRFAQGVGLVVTTTAAVAGLAFDAVGAATALTALLVVFATLEAAVGFCAGCFAFAQLVRFGLIPESVCADCADIWRRAA